MNQHPVISRYLVFTWWAHSDREVLPQLTSSLGANREATRLQYDMNFAGERERRCRTEVRGLERPTAGEKIQLCPYDGRYVEGKIFAIGL